MIPSNDLHWLDVINADRKTISNLESLPPSTFKHSPKRTTLPSLARSQSGLRQILLASNHESSNDAPPEAPPGPGGTRGECPKTPIAPFVLIPPALEEGNQAIGSIAYHNVDNVEPSIWFYLPYTAQDRAVREGVFKLQDGKGREDLMILRFTPNNPTPTFARIRLDSELINSEQWQAETTYRWSLRLNCEAEDGDITPVLIKGRIRTTAISPEVKSRLNAATTLEQRSQIYQQEELWYDWVQTLAEQGQESSSWSLFLESRFPGFENLAILQNTPISHEPITNSPLE
ncbi:MAG: DUF928 domain-containing protein [Spirulina sp. SIO3F2]|nr:DUF928 domain-containing protein [Spirulina sp. SIO3F2]